MRKKAQFYLIAAIIIVGIIVILASIANYIVTRKEPVKFYDLSEEFKEEGSRVVDYGLYSSDDKLEDLTDKFAVYSEEKDKGTELVFVYGNKSQIKIATYSTIKTGDVKLIVGALDYTVQGSDKLVADRETVSPPIPDQVKVQLLGQEYEFDLHEGENFLFVISKNVTEEDEVYITKKE